MGLLNIFRKKRRKEIKEELEKKQERIPSRVSEIELKRKDEKKEEKRERVSFKSLKRVSKIDFSKILIKPKITEKSTQDGVYTFIVPKEANKIQIKEAVFALYGVKPKKINIVKRKGKKRIYGRISGQTKSYKKAIIFLKKGEIIDLYSKSKK